MILTVDASVAIKWIINEPGCEEARRYLRDWQGSSLEMQYFLEAPALIELEVHNVLAGKLKRLEISEEPFLESSDILHDNLTISAVDAQLIHIARWMSVCATGAVADAEGQPLPHFLPFNIYDCLYIAHAHLNGGSLLTADKEQARVANALGVAVTLISF